MIGLKTASFRLAILVVFIGCIISKGEGFKQELWLYNDQGKGLYLSAQDPDLSNFSFFLATVTHYCAYGYWNPFTSTNFQNRLSSSFNLGSVETSNLTCADVNATDFKSLRFFGASDTSTDGISLYRGNNLDEEEILVTQEGAYTDIKHEILSVSATGNSSWMLFEGANLDGNSYCYDVPYPGWYFNYDRVISYNLTTVGSVFRGCDLKEIEVYKTQNLV